MVIRFFSRLGALMLVFVSMCAGGNALAMPLGAEFQVNTSTTGDQRDPKVAMLRNGGFVVVWQSNYPGCERFTCLAIYAQRHRADGTRIGPEFRVNNTTGIGQSSPAVAALDNGGFVVVWVSTNLNNSSEDFYYYTYSVHGQRFRADGTRAGHPFQASKDEPGDKVDPSVAALRHGGLMVVWAERDGIYGRHYLRDFTPAGEGPLQIQGRTVGNLYSLGSPSVAALGQGGFVVVWDSQNRQAKRDIHGWRFDAAGVRVGGKFRVNTVQGGNQDEPAVAHLEGGFVVVYDSSTADGSGSGISGQRFDRNGAVGPEFRTNTRRAGNQTDAAIAPLSNDGFVVVWASDGQDGDGFGIYAQRYDAAGKRVGIETRINTQWADEQTQPAVAPLENGGFVVIWTSDNQDGDGLGIFGQRFGPE